MHGALMATFAARPASRVGAATAAPATGTGAPIPAWSQPRLVNAPRDFTRFNRRLHAELTNPWLSEGHRIAADLGERRAGPAVFAARSTGPSSSRCPLS